jgi:hypothetical protein
VDGSGNAYVTTGFYSSASAFRITPGGMITQIIDSTGDGTHAIIGPNGIAVDGSGNVYVGGGASNNAFKITSLCNNVVCAASGQCYGIGVCDPATGECSNPNAANGTSCNDGTPCTKNDVCTSGVCGGTPYTCAAADQCHQAGTCNGDGTCSFANKANGSACNDGNACTLGDACRNGTCGGTYSCPTDKDQCKNGGWKSLIAATGQPFKNQGDCVSYVNTGK